MTRLTRTYLALLCLFFTTSPLFAAEPGGQSQRLDMGLDWGQCVTGCASDVDAECAEAAAEQIIPTGRPGFIYLEADNAELDRQQDELLLSGDSALRKATSDSA